MRAFALTRTRPSQTVSQTAPEFITAPNTLRGKVGGRFGGVDAAALAKAEEALKGLASQFGQWLQDELDKLDAARSAIGAQGATSEAMDRLYLCGHDLKGLGATYDYPLVSRVAGSLCKLMDSAGPRTAIPLTLIDAHIGAIRVIVRDEIHDPEHPTARLVAQALEDKVNAHIAVAKGSATAP